MSFLVNPEAHHLFATSFLYTGIGLFQAAILANGYFNKSYLKYDKLYYGLQATFFLIGLVLSLLFSAYPTIVISIATVMTLAMEVLLRNFISPKPRNSQLRIGICIKKILVDILY